MLPAMVRHSRTGKVRWVFHPCTHPSSVTHCGTAGAADDAPCNDLYSFGIGAYIIWGSIAAMRAAVLRLPRNNMQMLLLPLVHWAAVALKAAVLLLLWLVVAPILAGLLVDLAVIMPIRVPINESPLLSLYHDWVLGLILLKLWARVVTAQNHLLANHEWRARFLRLQQDGLRRLNARRTFQEIIAPVLLFLLTALSAPFLAVRAALPLLRLPPVLESAAFRFAWITALGVVGTARVWRRVCEWLASLHDAIRDDRYLVGRRLHNFQHQRR
ncbi:unnamed protein product [Closterium sp. Yama58-4]|nr:unnamed protein product [Closterium sp. Yama58-4]